MTFCQVNNVAATYITQVALTWPHAPDFIPVAKHVLLDILLQHCSQLQDLDIEVRPGDLDFLSTFFTAKWPRLTRFTISTYALRVYMPQAVDDGLCLLFSQFIKNHPNLERLFVTCPDLISPQHTNFGQLSKLRGLGIPSCSNPGLLFDPTVPDNLECLVFRLDSSTLSLFSSLSYLHTVMMEISYSNDPYSTLENLPVTIRHLSLKLLWHPEV